MKQKALRRVAGLEAPGSEAAPPAGPLALRPRLQPGPRPGVRGGSGRQRGLRGLRVLRRRILRLGPGGRGGDLDVRGRCGDAARRVGAGAEESRVLNAAAALHGPDGFSPLRRV